MHNRILLIGTLTLSLVAVVAAGAPPEWVGKERREIRQERLRGGGLWKGRGRKQHPRQRWSVDVERDDTGRIHGTLAVDGSVLLTGGRVDGAIDGRRVSGTITGEDGEQTATFYGVITRDGVRGSYVDRTGETGDWIWQGPAPE